MSSKFLCYVCQNECSSVICCAKCKVGRYCSQVCQLKHQSHHDKFCPAIQQLKTIEVNKLQPDVCQIVNPEFQNSLIKLIGDKPLLNCKLNGVETCVLWDTGSMISVVDAVWMENKVPEAEIQPISDFLGNEEFFKFTAANNSEVVMIGVVMLEFEFGNSGISVPFLVTSEKLTNPILGYNVIEYFITENHDITKPFQVSCEVPSEKIKVMVNLIRKKALDSDWVGKYKTVKPISIPAYSKVKIKCKIKGDVKGQTRARHSLYARCEWGVG